jgi:diadenosine tetraphosphate (Ap4A) HIT family hydrolase
MPTLIHQRVEMACAGTNPTVICRVPSGWMVLGDTQFLRGYSLLLPDPVVPGLNTLAKEQRAQFLRDMAILGDALLEVTDAYRINYAIMCNTEPALHAHVTPRYMTEPEEFRTRSAWNYPPSQIDAIPFDYERDKELMKQIAEAVQRRL